MTDSQIDPSARVGTDVSLGPRASVGGRSEIGDGARLGADAAIGGDARLGAGVVVGDRAQVHDGALLAAGAIVEDDVLIGPRAMLVNDRYPRAVTSTVHVPAAAAQSDHAIVIRHGASIGAGAIVLAGVEVGRNALVGAGAVVTRPVAPHALVAGSPAKRIGWVCVCGARLVDADGDPAPAQPAHYAIDSALHCSSCGRVYAYVPDAETVHEASGPRTELPA